VSLSHPGAQRFRYDFCLPVMQSVCAYIWRIATTKMGSPR
jgi:hypothetical protein